MNWTYMDSEYTEIHDDSLEGFIYEVDYEDEDGNLYIYYGKKNFYLTKKKHFGKKKIAEMADKRKKTYEYVKTEDDWKTYTGSCKSTDGLIPVAKRILMFARSKRELTYIETKMLFVNGALEDTKCLNANISGTFFRDNLY